VTVEVDGVPLDTGLRNSARCWATARKPAATPC